MAFVLLTLRIVFRIILVIALADFLAGTIHWAEDAYFTETTPVVGPLFIRPNIVHHHLSKLYIGFGALADEKFAFKNVTFYVGDFRQLHRVIYALSHID